MLASESFGDIWSDVDFKRSFDCLINVKNVEDELVSSLHSFSHVIRRTWHDGL